MKKLKFFGFYFGCSMAGAAIKFGAILLMLTYMNHWFALALHLMLNVPLGFMLMCAEDSSFVSTKKRIVFSSIYMCAVCALVFYIMRMCFLYYGPVGLLVYLIADGILYACVRTSEEARTKTASPYEEANCDENHSVDGPAQTISAVDNGPDPERDSNGEETEKHSGRYHWGDGTPVA